MVDLIHACFICSSFVTATVTDLLKLLLKLFLHLPTYLTDIRVNFQDMAHCREVFLVNYDPPFLHNFVVQTCT